MADKDTTVPSFVKAQLAQDGKADRAKIRAALKRRKAQLLRQLADCEEMSAEVDEKLEALLPGGSMMGERNGR